MGMKKGGRAFFSIFWYDYKMTFWVHLNTSGLSYQGKTNIFVLCLILLTNSFVAIFSPIVNKLFSRLIIKITSCLLAYLLGWFIFHLAKIRSSWAFIKEPRNATNGFLLTLRSSSSKEAFDDLCYASSHKQTFAAKEILLIFPLSSRLRDKLSE